MKQFELQTLIYKLFIVLLRVIVNKRIQPINSEEEKNHFVKSSL